MTSISKCIGSVCYKVLIARSYKNLRLYGGPQTEYYCEFNGYWVPLGTVQSIIT